MYVARCRHHVLSNGRRGDFWNKPIGVPPCVPQLLPLAQQVALTSSTPPGACFPSSAIVGGDGITGRRGTVARFRCSVPCLAIAAEYVAGVARVMLALEMGDGCGADGDAEGEGAASAWPLIGSMAGLLCFGVGMLRCGGDDDNACWERPPGDTTLGSGGGGEVAMAVAVGEAATL
eukprot:CAMPEP_0175966812 /NCGR_PEP_ID=MMETSP0108-20121206/38917_1 /TAXON_ID=195067 ORGANISM="Goniomonas pacifica, Strain CCMP1869" /NCGR_SAMPLE_ID=MMETSP0108 /ASSEMBLY_ACC=CAM_ASM_000204 /LENGTH=175 /DNA_ID=CAMNT_0017295131 /DNA_START=455 /DNA_END=983 /DNA_ORIENTATION=+